MGIHNSIAVYTTLYELLYLDIAECYAVDIATTQRDVEEIQRRVAEEGIGFLTKTLPSYAKALDRALTSSATFDPIGLTTDARGYPKLFGFLFERVFDSVPSDGVYVLTVKAEMHIQALRHLRQLCIYLYKLELTYDKTTTKAVIDQFVAVDRELPEMEGLSTDGKAILGIARNLATDVFGRFDHRDISPRHGPGKVATGESGVGKTAFTRLYKTLDVEYPFTEYFMSGLNHIADEPDYIEGATEVAQAVAKVALVPKDSRGPRLISMEPLELQWIQQGLMKAITPLLESHRLTKGHVNFTDQEINQRLALEGSRTGKWATLDMKEASDRVSLDLVKELFSHCPCLAGFLACRSEATRLPDGTIMPMKKFAPMGSALCFPVESFVFYALSVGVLVHILGWTRRRARKAIYVYGDDLIVEAATVAALTHHLPEFGLMFNLAKCCSSGLFRESCGCEAYNGFDVTPVRLRKQLRLPRAFTAHLGAVTIASTVAQSNRLHECGYYRAAEFLRQWVERHLGGLPLFNEAPSELTYGGLYWVRPEVSRSVFPKGTKRRFNRHIHQMEVRSWSLVSDDCRIETNSWRSILQWFSKPEAEKPTDTYAIRARFQLKPRWNIVR